MKKLSIANVKHLTKNEMKKIMAGSGGFGSCPSNCTGDCTFSDGSAGHCRLTSTGDTCYCTS